jgi:hypothetical protein
LLLEKGYLSDFAEFRNIADFHNSSKALVAQPGRGLPLIDCKNGKKESLGGIWTPRPLPLGSRLFEPYLTLPGNDFDSAIIISSLFVRDVS